MASIIRPTPAQMTRRFVVLVSAVFAVLVAQAQILLGWGQSPEAFAADSDATLKVAGFAFSIWGVIYLGLLLYAVRQVLPATGESALLRRLGWPSVAAFLAIGGWIVAAAFDWEAATIGLIIAALLVLLVPLLASAREIRALSSTDMERWTVVWPLALLAGWLSIAAPVNLLTVLTGNGALPASPSPTVWAVAAILIATALALGVTWALRTPAFALPVAWGLLGVFTAEQARNGTLAGTAIVAGAALLIGAAVLTFRLRPPVERPA